MMKIPEEIDIAIIAPFPTVDRTREGWMSRISVVDDIIKSHKRLYIHFSEHHNGRRDEILIQQDNDGFEALLSPSDVFHQEILGRIIDQVRYVYVHTVHLAEYIQPWLSSGKFIVDFHGIVPEEEIMMGHPERAPKYEVLEQKVLRDAKLCVMVTEAMRKHYQKKYPKLSPKVELLPIVEGIKNRVEKKNESIPELPIRVVYAGGTQTWQNIEAMLHLCGDTKNFAVFTFLSHDWQIIQQKAASLGCEKIAHFRFCEKKDLASEYALSDFGLVMRDDTAVNRVSCPTKLFEYLSLGLVPIVRSSALGDFEELGYGYITENEFRNGFFPDQASRRWIVENNFDVVDRLRKRFLSGANRIIQLME